MSWNTYKDSSYLMYLGENNVYGWAISQKLPVDGFKWKKIHLNLIKKFIYIYDKDSDKACILELDVIYSIISRNNLPEIMKINNYIKLVCNFHDKKSYVVHIRALQQASNHVLVFKKVRRVI